MGQYLLSTYVVEGEVPGAPTTPEEMQAFMQRVDVRAPSVDGSLEHALVSFLEQLGR